MVGGPGHGGQQLGLRHSAKTCAGRLEQRSTHFAIYRKTCAM
jgi:hypothetical protein